MFLNVSTQWVLIGVRAYPSHTADALQQFSQTRTPAPPWVAMHQLSIPQETSSMAAKYLVEALGGKEMAFKIAGGTTWWQVRAGAGVECEWIVAKKTARQSGRDEATSKAHSRHQSTDGLGPSETPSGSGSQTPKNAQGSGDTEDDDRDSGCECTMRVL